ncbi:MAG: hypothetical protein ACPL7K_00145, partial [Armatimonadota bacterium]
MDYLVGTRFHSVVFAQGLGIPSMAIAYGGNKANGIMGDMGLADYVVPIDKVTEEQLCNMFDSLIEKSDEIRRKLADWLAKARTERDRLVETLQRAVAS